MVIDQYGSYVLMILFFTVTNVLLCDSLFMSWYVGKLVMLHVAPVSRRASSFVA